MDPRFAHIRDWIFDLDNCLYPASAGLFSLIDERMGAYIQRLLGCDSVEAKRVQKAHFHEHGTTLAGLMRHHGVDPHDFLGFVHDIDLARIAADPALVAAMDRLPGRKFVFTNASENYARRVLERALSGIEDGASVARMKRQRNRGAAAARHFLRVSGSIASRTASPTMPGRLSRRP